MKLVRLILFILLPLSLLLTGAYFYFTWLVTPLDSQAVNSVITVVIPKGASTQSIADQLHSSNLTRSPLAFKLAVARLGISRSLQAGSFQLSPSSSVLDIAQQLTKGSQDIWVTLLEGWRLEQYASALEVAFSTKNTPFSSAKFLELAEGLEGQLYPDTYLIPLSYTSLEVVQLLANTMNSKLVPLEAQIADSPLNRNQILTLASLIEREARTSESRRMVADILIKRLNIGMALQVDATMQYARDNLTTPSTYWQPPFARDKELDSPYNTYRYSGLPPAPICAPSLDSIKAVLNPIPNPYYYYITDPQGNMRYAETLEQHNQNVATYLR